MKEQPRISRRKFIGQSACAGLGATGLLSAMGTLRLFNASLAAQTIPGDDYKALICVFLYGGNDANNTIVPMDLHGYNTYSSARGPLALPRNTLLPVNVRNTDQGEFGLHPSMARLRELFQKEKMAFITNVGTLVAPITRAEYVSGGAAVPPYLFSHSDQMVQWQTSVPDSPRKIGWAGRLADLKHSLNGSSQISMNISVDGNNIFQVGEEVFQYHVTDEGSVGLYEYDAEWDPRPQQAKALRNTLGMSYSHLFEAEYASVMSRAIANDTLMKETLATIPEYTNKFTHSRSGEGGLTWIGSELRMILRLIAAQKKLGMRRQIFFCSLGGFDTHDAQLDAHADLLRELSNAIADFYQATADLGVADNVTLFTASDFNRTYITNGKGTDHAWGSHHFVVGGAVKGGRLYGQMPVLRADGPDDTGDRGSWIPTTSVDEYSATLAKWFGVRPSEMPLVLPNINRFSNPDLGFMIG